MSMTTIIPVGALNIDKDKTNMSKSIRDACSPDLWERYINGLTCLEMYIDARGKHVVRESQERAYIDKRRGLVKGRLHE